MVRVILIVLLCSFFACTVSRHQISNLYSDQLSTYGRHVVADCILTFGLLPVTNVDTVALNQYDSHLKLLIRIDECEMDGGMLDYDRQSMLDFYFKGSCISNMKIEKFVKHLESEFKGHSMEVNNLDLPRVESLTFELENLRCVDGKSYAVKDGVYLCKVEDGFINNVERIFYVSKH